jgi:hypothetical protein
LAAGEFSQVPMAVVPHTGFPLCPAAGTYPCCASTSRCRARPAPSSQPSRQWATGRRFGLLRAGVHDTTLALAANGLKPSMLIASGSGLKRDADAGRLATGNVRLDSKVADILRD